MCWIASALLGVAFLGGPLRAEAGWQELHGRDADGGELAAAPLQRYALGPPPVKLDETITYPGYDWYVSHGTQAGGSGATTFTESQPFTSYQATFEPPQSVPPGGSLLTLAKLLQGADPPLRAALLRHFCHSLARLRTRLVGLDSVERKEKRMKKKKKKKNGKHDKNEPQDTIEIRIGAVSAQLAGVVGAAEGSSNSGKALAKFLLAPFGRLFKEAEQLLSDVALEGNPALMITALNKLAPPLVRGLTYLESPESQGAARILEPARDSLLERAREIDNVLLEAQSDLVGVLHAYPRDFARDELEVERQQAALEGDPDHEQYIPPVHGEWMDAASANDEKLRRQARFAFLLSLLLTISTVLTALTLASPLASTGRQDSGGSAGSSHRWRQDMDGGSRSGDAGSSGSETGMGGRAFMDDEGTAFQDTLRRHRRWIQEQREAASQAFAEHSDIGEPWGEPFPRSPHAGGHFIVEPGSPEVLPPHFVEPHSVPPLPSAPPLGPPFVRVPRVPPPPSYEEAMRDIGRPQ